MLRKICALAVLAALALCESALAVNVLNLPAGIKKIGAETFMGNWEIDEVVIPEGAVSIGDRAFKDMGHLQTIEIPASVTTIGSDILQGAMDAVRLLCRPGSAAMDYAIAHNIDYEAGTLCRALIIGNQYPDTVDALRGPYNDAQGLTQALLSHSVMTWDNILTCNDFSYSEIDREIDNVLGPSRDQDISLFYFSGHGGRGGTLLTADFEDYTPRHLREKLDKIRGRKIIILDTCFSGGLFQDGDGAKMAPGLKGSAYGLQDFQNDFLNGFRRRDATSRSVFDPSDYFIMTAARYDQESKSFDDELDDADKTPFSYGMFTYSLCRAIGYDFKTKKKIAMLADKDGDVAVSLLEAQQFILEAVKELWKETENKPEDLQLVQLYPANCAWFAPFRRIYWE